MKVGDILYYIENVAKAGEIWKVTVEKITEPLENNFITLQYGTKKLRPIMARFLDGKLFSTDTEAAVEAKKQLQYAKDRAEARIENAEVRKQKTIKLANAEIERLGTLQLKVTVAPIKRKTHFSKTIQ